MTFLHQLRLTATALLAMACLCQCEAKRTYGEVKPGSISFDQAAWGGQGGGSDEQEIRSKFAERGYTIGNDGSLVADKPNLYSNQTAKGMDGKYGKKTARLSKNEASTKAFRTPEYIKRQEFAGTKQSSDSGSSAREGNFSQSRSSDDNRMFGRKTKSTTKMATSNATSSTFRNSNQVFSTNQDTKGTKGISTAPRATGTAFRSGYQDTAGMTMDGVKQMLNPGSYSRAKGL